MSEGSQTCQAASQHPHCYSDLRLYANVQCTVIHQTASEKAFAIFLGLYDILVIAICVYWLLTFWRYRLFRAYGFLIKVRRPLYMILSYAIILPLILEEGLATIYLFWAPKPRDDIPGGGINDWTNYDGTPIYYNRNLDTVLHFLYWFAFWAFFQLKIFKLWMLRYDHEYNREMSNIEWKDQLGLRTVQPTSFFIRYRSILGNSFLMFFMQLVILVVIIFIQIFIRLYPVLKCDPSASTIEGVVILIIAVAQFIFIVWLMHQIREVNDNFHLKAESSRIFMVSLCGGAMWIIGLIVASIFSSIPFILIKAGTIVLFTTWICVYCYIETIWVLKRIDRDWSKHNSGRRKKKNVINNGDHSGIYATLKLNDILKVQEGFEAMMRFLVKEFSCENLLCYVELSQYITKWAPLARTAGAGDFEEIDDDGSVTAEHMQSVTAEHMQSSAQSSSNYKNYPNHQHKKQKSVVDIHMDDKYAAMAEQRQVEKFTYFEQPDFLDELTHYEYIMQKYINDSACLQINISGGLRHEAQKASPGQDSDRIITMTNNIRAELWSLMRDSFSRFRITEEYKRLADVLSKKQLKNIQLHSPRNHVHPPSNDFSSQSR